MTEQELFRFLTAQTGRPIALRINTNTQSLLTAQNGKGRTIQVSVHRMFLDAPKTVRDALAEFIVRPNTSNRRVIREFIAENTHKIAVRKNPRRMPPGTPAGEYYDLLPIAQRINRMYFQNRLEFDIIWGRRPKEAPRNQYNITLGLCQSHQKLIRIHPILDTAKVPLFYLEYIIYHEMAHLAVPARIGAHGKLMHHTADFYAVEQQYPRYKQALEWQDRNLTRLMTEWCRTKAKPRRTGQLGMF